jgi:hypothetical protein
VWWWAILLAQISSIVVLLGIICAFKLAKTDTFTNLKQITIKKNIIQAYLCGQHFPVYLDFAFYAIVIVLFSISSNFFLSTIWLAMAFFDFKLREYAHCEEAVLFVSVADQYYAYIEKILAEESERK